MSIAHSVDNKAHSTVRGVIERAIGDFKNKFKIFASQYSFNMASFNLLFKYCVALHNIHVCACLQRVTVVNHALFQYDTAISEPQGDPLPNPVGSMLTRLNQFKGRPVQVVANQAPSIPASPLSSPVLLPHSQDYSSDIDQEPPLKRRKFIEMDSEESEEELSDQQIDVITRLRQRIINWILSNDQVAEKFMEYYKVLNEFEAAANAIIQYNMNKQYSLEDLYDVNHVDEEYEQLRADKNRKHRKVMDIEADWEFACLAKEDLDYIKDQIENSSDNLEHQSIENLGSPASGNGQSQPMVPPRKRKRSADQQTPSKVQ